MDILKEIIKQANKGISVDLNSENTYAIEYDRDIDTLIVLNLLFEYDVQTHPHWFYFHNEHVAEEVLNKHKELFLKYYEEQ